VVRLIQPAGRFRRREAGEPFRSTTGRNRRHAYSSGV
jgi:hypothetical protein